MDYGKLLFKLIKKAGFSSSSMIILFLIIILVISPVLWVGTLIGSWGDKEDVKDFRQLVDQWQSINHISMDYADLLACTMNEKYTKNPIMCINFFGDDGKISDRNIDISLAPTYSIYKDNVYEFLGKIPDRAFEQLWIPTLYAKEHYKLITWVDDVTKETISDWVLDYVEEKKYKDYCDANEPQTKCKLIREGFYTYPYTPPTSTKSIKERYGYAFADSKDGSLTFKERVSFNGNDVLSITTGWIESVENNTITAKYNHKDFEFFAEYSGFSSVSIYRGQEIEWNERIGLASGIVELKTYVIIDGKKNYFNPLILVGIKTSNIDFDMSFSPGESIPTNIENFNFMKPFEPYVITQPFGVMNIDGKLHSGIDLQPNYADRIAHPISAGVTGKVTAAGYDSISGYTITLQCEASGVLIKYNHMNAEANYTAGQHVNQGDIIGYVGKTGLSTGYHTHLMFIVDGQAINPASVVPF